MQVKQFTTTPLKDSTVVQEKGEDNHVTNTDNAVHCRVHEQNYERMGKQHIIRQ